MYWRLVIIPLQYQQIYSQAKVLFCFLFIGMYKVGRSIAKGRAQSRAIREQRKNAPKSAQVLYKPMEEYKDEPDDEDWTNNWFIH